MSFANDFCVEYDDECWVLAVSKNVYTYDEAGLTYDYVYVIELQQVPEPAGHFMANVYMVPCFDSLCYQGKNSVWAETGFERDYCYPHEYYYLIDTSVPFKVDIVSFDDEHLGQRSLLNIDGVIELLDKYAADVRFMDRLYGFYMDKFVNRIGTTGWDVMEYAINDGMDPMEAGMERVKARHR